MITWEVSCRLPRVAPYPFYHRTRVIYGCPHELRHVLIECDWYTPTGVETPSGLLQVNYDEENSRANRWTFLKDMYRANVVLWPTYSHTPQFELSPRTFVVVHHVAVAHDNQKDDDEDQGEEEDM